MDNLIKDICQKTGIDHATAQKVATYLKANVTRIPQLLQGADGAGGIAGKVGDNIRR